MLDTKYWNTKFKFEIARSILRLKWSKKVHYLRKLCPRSPFKTFATLFWRKKVVTLFASSFVFFLFVDGGAFSEGDLMKSFFAQVDSDATS